MIDWLENWFYSQCDSNWEHGNGIRISTLDNPGWDVIIDLNETNIELADKEWLMVKFDENNWYGYKIIGNVFTGSGDPMKLGFIISLFKSLVEGAEN